MKRRSLNVEGEAVFDVAGDTTWRAAKEKRPSEMLLSVAKIALCREAGEKRRL